MDFEAIPQFQRRNLRVPFPLAPKKELKLIPIQRFL